LKGHVKIALSGEQSLEETVELSWDRLHNE